MQISPIVVNFSENQKCKSLQFWWKSKMPISPILVEIEAEQSWCHILQFCPCTSSENNLTPIKYKYTNREQYLCQVVCWYSLNKKQMSLAVDKTSEGQTVRYGEKWGNFGRILSNKSVHTHIDNSFWLELYSTPNFGKNVISNHGWNFIRHTFGKH